MAQAEMDHDFAVFNGHVNNAADRALEHMRKHKPRYAKVIERFKATGIMEIFKQDPTPATKMYVELVHKFVNEKPKKKRRK